MHQILHDEDLPVSAFADLCRDSITYTFEAVEEFFQSEEFQRRYVLLGKAFEMSKETLLIWTEVSWILFVDVITFCSFFLRSIWPYLQSVPGKIFRVHKEHPEIVLAELIGIILLLIIYIASKYVFPWIKACYAKFINSLHQLKQLITNKIHLTSARISNNISDAKHFVSKTFQETKRIVLYDFVYPIAPHLLIVIPSFAVLYFLPSILTLKNIAYLPIPVPDLITTIYPAFVSASPLQPADCDRLIHLTKYWICFGVLTAAFDVLSSFSLLRYLFSFVIGSFGYETEGSGLFTFPSLFYILLFVWLQTKGAPVLYSMLNPLLASWNKAQQVLAKLIERLLGTLVLLGVVDNSFVKDISSSVVDGLFLLPAAFLVLSFQSLAYLGFVYVLLWGPTMKSYRIVSKLPRGKAQKRKQLMEALVTWSVVSIYYVLVEHSPWLEIFKQVPLYYNLQLLLVSIALFPGSPGIHSAMQGMTYAIQRCITSAEWLKQSLSRPSSEPS